MCGIVGILGSEPVAPQIVEALRRLEYRGYDSAGIATLESGSLTRERAEGKLRNLEAKLKTRALMGCVGIGHTRWATHGKPDETNAHPHATDRLALVHNGIIENFRQIKEELIGEGVAFHTETDTEVVAHLITKHLKLGCDHKTAMKLTLDKLEGAFALAIIFDGEEDLMVGARRGSPLAIGHGDGEMFMGSDAIALAPFTDRITYLDDGDWAMVSRTALQIYNSRHEPVERPMITSVASSLLAEKGNYKHYMLKEMHEQPEVVGHTLAHYLDFSSSRAQLPGDFVDFRGVDRITVAACGTAYYAGLIAKYWFERLARLPVDIDVASEFRYREAPLSPRGLSVVVSQSGETADTLASLRYMKAQGQKVAAIINVATSTMAREADFALPTLAGAEIGVASTKALTCQLAALVSLALAAGRRRGVLSEEDERELVQSLSEVPRLMSQALRLGPSVERIAKNLNGIEHALFLGRGPSYGVALEGALKLKELSYIHAEAYAAGELKHGPIALVDKKMPVVVVAPHDRWFSKTISNMQEVAARQGKIILLTDKTGREQIGESKNIFEEIILPEVPTAISPLVYTVVLQQLAYHSAVYRGHDVDQPRNLAKSVTVE
jgi:glucosamine--fructose-6-phosphate aminotransferase (isomerizing)